MCSLDHACLKIAVATVFILISHKNSPKFPIHLTQAGLEQPKGEVAVLQKAKQIYPTT